MSTKILYAVQGTGNGHLARAREIIPLLRAHGEVDVLVSGQHGEVDVGTPVTYKYKGLGFIFGKKGGVDLVKTWARNRIRRLYDEVRSLPLEGYDIIINDFEPVSAWACRRAGVPCYGLSHQEAVRHPAAPQPEKGDLIGRAILNHFAPTTRAWGFHFDRYAPDIYTPVIRGEVRALNPGRSGEWVVYLPAYDDERIAKTLSQISVPWRVFSKHADRGHRVGQICFEPISHDRFIEALAGAEGVLCGAGFETPAEALFLGKPLAVIPMKNQYEQQCNAAALAAMGVPVLKNLKKKRAPDLEAWVSGAYPPPVVDYPDQTAAILEEVIRHASLGQQAPPLPRS